MTKHIGCEVRFALRMLLLGQCRRYIGSIGGCNMEAIVLIESEKVVGTWVRAVVRKRWAWEPPNL